MGPSDYQENAAGADLSNRIGGNARQVQPNFSGLAQQREVVQKAPGQLEGICNRLSKINEAVGVARDQLMAVNERLGVPHIPSQASEKPSPTAPPSDGTLSKIETYLDLIREGLLNLDYQLQRVQEL